MAYNKETGRYQWDIPGIPHKGWYCTLIEDLGYGCGDFICEMCGKENIRFIHTMIHPEHGSIRVGCVCSGHMSGDYEEAINRENQFKNKISMRERWITRKWKMSKKGNVYLTLKGINITIFKKYGEYKCVVDGDFSNKSFNDINDAKLFAFERFWDIRQKKKEKEKEAGRSLESIFGGHDVYV